MFLKKTFLFQLFHNDIAGGQSKASVHSWIKAEDGTATDKELTITLPEFREAKMTLKCEVKVRREIAGRVSSITKSGEVCIVTKLFYPIALKIDVFTIKRFIINANFMF